MRRFLGNIVWKSQTCKRFRAQAVLNRFRTATGKRELIALRYSIFTLHKRLYTHVSRVSIKKHGSR